MSRSKESHARRETIYPEIKNKLLLAGYSAEKEASKSGLINGLLSDFFKKIPDAERARLIEIGKAISKNSY